MAAINVKYTYILVGIIIITVISTVLLLYHNNKYTAFSAMSLEFF